MPGLRDEIDTDVVASILSIEILLPAFCENDLLFHRFPPPCFATVRGYGLTRGITQLRVKKEGARRRLRPDVEPSPLAC